MNLEYILSNLFLIQSPDDIDDTIDASTIDPVLDRNAGWKVLMWSLSTLLNGKDLSPSTKKTLSDEVKTCVNFISSDVTTIESGYHPYCSAPLLFKDIMETGKVDKALAGQASNISYDDFYDLVIQYFKPLWDR